MRRMDRRTFLRWSAQSAALAMAPPALARGAPMSKSTALYSRALVIDSLCSPFSSDADAPTDDAIRQVARSGISVVNCTVSDRTYEGTVANLARVESYADRHPELFAIVRRHADIARAKRDGKVGIIPGFQYTSFLEEDPDRVEVFRELGVRIMQVTYNLRGAWGDGCLEPSDAGLSKAGREIVAKMNVLGIAVDTSHSGNRTTSEAIELSAKPIVISHAGCAAIEPHPRNKPDALLRALADRGGYLGVYLMPYLVASPTVPTREHVLAHLLHAIDVCGADHVGIGSDGSIEGVRLSPEQKQAFDEDIARRKKLGIGAPGEDRYPYVPDLNGPDHMEVIAAELHKRGQPDSVIEKVLGANFARVIGESWGGA